MSKWQKIDPAEIKVGDRVRHVEKLITGRLIRENIVKEVKPDSIRLGYCWFNSSQGTWYIAKPKKAKPELSPTEKAWFTMPTISEPYTPPFPPPTRPDEPPVGSFFRVDRTGFEFWRFASMEDGYGYWQISPRSEEPDWERWDDITEPGDTITLLELTEKGDKKDGGV